MSIFDILSRAINKTFQSCLLQGAKASVAFLLLVGLIPLMFGLLLEVVALMPARVPLNQSPVFFLWQDWALGAMYTKITIALTFMGPEWWLKRAIEQLYQDGLRGLNLGIISCLFTFFRCLFTFTLVQLFVNLCQLFIYFLSAVCLHFLAVLLTFFSCLLTLSQLFVYFSGYLIPELVVPAVISLGLALAVPYVVAHGIVPMIINDFETVIFIQRRIYPSLLLLISVFGLIILQLKQFRKLYEHIKNDR